MRVLVFALSKYINNGGGRTFILLSDYIGQESEKFGAPGANYLLKITV